MSGRKNCCLLYTSINQSTPESGTARVSVSFRTGGMHLSAEALLAELRRQPTVVDIRRGV